MKLLLDGEEGCCPPEKVLWASFSRGIVGMGDIISKMLLSGYHHTDAIYRFITISRKFKIMITSLEVSTSVLKKWSNFNANKHNHVKIPKPKRIGGLDVWSLLQSTIFFEPDFVIDNTLNCLDLEYCLDSMSCHLQVTGA